MDNKQVTKVLDDSFLEFIEIFNDECKNILKEKAYFAGGCIYSLVNDKEVHDYDIFLTDVNETEKISNAIKWSYKTEYALTHGKYQIVIKYFGNPDECVGQFDFKHNMYYYVPFSDVIGCACDDYKYLTSNELTFNSERARDLEGVYLRINKFKKKGFIIPKGLKKLIKRRTSKSKIYTYKKKRKTNNGYC